MVLVCVHIEASRFNVPIASGPQLLIDDVRVTFKSVAGHQVGESWSATLSAVNALSLRSVRSVERVSVGQDGGMAAAGGMALRSGMRAGDGVRVTSGQVRVLQGSNTFGQLMTDGTMLHLFDWKRRRHSY